MDSKETESEAAEIRKIDVLDEASMRRLRQLASRALRKRAKPTDPTTMSIVDQVVLNLLRAGDRGSLARFDSEQELTRYLCGAIRNHFVSLARNATAARRPPESNREDQPDCDVFVGGKLASESVLDVHLALEELALHEPRAAQIVELLFFGGCTQAEAAEVLETTVDRLRSDWEYARAWLKRKIAPSRRGE